jgi:DNA polymerase-3 subunit epsilon
MIPFPTVKITNYAAAAAQWKFNEWNRQNDWVVLDTETTGLRGAEVVEIAVVDPQRKVLFHSLVKPKAPIPREAAEIHGITNDMVKNSPTWPEVWKALYPLIRDKLILIYNQRFDLQVLRDSFRAWTREELEQAGLKPHDIYQALKQLRTDCVMRAYADLRTRGRWVRLEEAAGKSVHRAVDDCLATIDVIRSCHNPGFTSADLKRTRIFEHYQAAERELSTLRQELRQLSERLDRTILRHQRLLNLLLLDGESLERVLDTEAAAALDEEL